MSCGHSKRGLERPEGVSLLDKFLGRRPINDSGAEPLVANLGIKDPLTLQVLFAEPRSFETKELTRDLRTFDRSMDCGRCEVEDQLAKEGKLFGLAGWDKHIVRFFGFDIPMAADAVEACVAPAHYPQNVKDRARGHRAHANLFYAGYEASALEQYVALAATATVLGRVGGIVVTNARGHTSLPMSLLLDIAATSDSIRMLRELPLPYLYCGFVKHEVEDVQGVWMRTYGAPCLGLPDLAAHATGHQEGQRYFDDFENVFRYVLDSGKKLGRGHTMQIGAREYMRLRAPKLNESFLVPSGELLVMEVIDADDINR
jgi:hypothetical protein